MRKFLYVCLALLVGAIVAGCGSSNAKPSGSVSKSGGEVGSSKTYAEFRLGVPTFGSVMLWTDDAYYQSAEMESLVVQNLVELESDGNVKPGGLTSSMEQPNATTYVYKLKRGVRFSDGTPVTAADVVYSLKLNLGKESEMALFWADVASVSERGGSTVVVKLKRPKFEWQQIMATTSQVLEKAAAERGGGQKTLGTSSNLPIGSGPWTIASYTPESGGVLEPSSYWKGAQRPAKKIVFTEFKQEATMALALRSGEIDGSEWFTGPRLFEHIPGTRMLTVPGAGITRLWMDVRVPPLNDVHVRRAIAYAANVPGMIKSQFGPGIATEAIADGSTAQFYVDLGSKSEVSQMLASLPTYKFDLAAAKRELAKSSCAHGCEVNVQAQESGGEVAEGQILVGDLDKIGIHAKLQELSAAQEAAVTDTNKSQIGIGEFTNIYPGAEVLPDLTLPSSSITNFARYSNTEVDRLLIKLGETSNSSTRVQLMGKILRIVNEEEPYRPLYTHDEWMVLSNKYVFPEYSQWTSNFTSWALDVKLAH